MKQRMCKAYYSRYQVLLLVANQTLTEIVNCQNIITRIVVVCTKSVLVGTWITKKSLYQNKNNKIGHVLQHFACKNNGRFWKHSMQNQSKSVNDNLLGNIQLWRKVEKKDNFFQMADTFVEFRWGSRLYYISFLRLIFNSLDN